MIYQLYKKWRNNKKRWATIFNVSTFFIVFVMFISSLSISYGQDTDIKETTDQPQQQIICFDSMAMYKQAITDTKATTGSAGGIDLTTKANAISKLLLVNSYIYGSNSICTTNGEMLTTEESVNANGILASIHTQIGNSIVALPGVQLDQYLAEEFIPGYKKSEGVYAQDGYHFLKDNIKLDTYWEITRNFAYLGFIVVLIIIGFMIMFRKKLNGQAQVTIMTALPNIVIGLLLVTFSFAIAGIIMDIGRMLINVIGTRIFASLGGDVISIKDIGGLIKKAMDASSPAWVVNTTTATAGLVSSVAALNFVGSGGEVSGTTMMLIINAAKIVATGIKYASAIVLLKYAILGAVVTYASLRIFFTIIITYFKLFLDVILGPIYILVGSVPGNSNIIAGWFKRLIAHIMVFGIIFGIVNFAWVIALSDVMQSNLNFFTDGVSADVVPDWLIQMKGLILIAGYFLAAGAPGIANEIMKVSSSKGFANAGAAAKNSLKKIPMVGKLAQ